MALNQDRQTEKRRFEKLKQAEMIRGRDEQAATHVAAQEVKSLREREGRAKDRPYRRRAT